MPSFDGLRAFAVAGVLAFHGELGFVPGGFLGVSAFFTLSGFLITSLLLVEHEAHGSIDLPAFWARRARRLLPAALLTLGAVVVFGATVASADQLRELRGDVLAALGYAANWRFLFSERSYADLFADPSPVQHFWSLAIEEQFYVGFPLMAAGLLVLGRGRRRTLAAGLGVLAVASAILMALLASPYRDTARVYYGTDTRAAELLVGALLACLLAGRDHPASRAGRALLGAAGGAALVTLLAAWHVASEDSRWLYEGGLAAHAVLTAAVIAAARLPGPLASLLSVAPLRALGKISYGVYLYHWPVFLWLSPERTGLDPGALFAARAALTLAVAAVSYLLVERPIRSGHRLAGYRPRLVTPVAAGGVALALVAVTADPPPPSIVFEPALSRPPPTAPVAATRSPPPSEVPTTTTTLPAVSRATAAPPRDMHRPLEAPRPLRVLVVGDSVGLSLGRGLERWGQNTGRAVVWNEGRMYCSLGRYADRVYGNGIEHHSDGCNDWGDRWAQDIDSFDPDTVVVLFSFWEIIGRRLPEWKTYLMPGDPAFDEWMLSEYRAAADVLSARGARVVWLTLPCLEGTEDVAEGDIDHVNEAIIAATAEARPASVRVVDLFGWLCPGGEFTPLVAGVADGRPDGAHFSDAGADAAAAWLGSQLLGD